MLQIEMLHYGNTKKVKTRRSDNNKNFKLEWNVLLNYASNVVWMAGYTENGLFYM